MEVATACQVARLAQKYSFVPQQLTYIDLNALFLSAKDAVHHRHVLRTYIWRSTQN